MSFRKKLYIFVIFFSCLFQISVFSQDGSGGQPGAFLRIPINARANGMGGAFTSIADDPSAGWWNPAGFAFINRFQVSGMYTNLTMDRIHNFAGISLPFGNGNTLGISWIQFGVKDIDGRDLAGQPTQKFDDKENAMGISYAFRMGPYFALGVTGKYIFHSISEYKATGYGLDAGILMNIENVFHLGFVVQDISSKIKWNTESGLEETFPKVYRAGLGISGGEIPFLLSIDAIKQERVDGIKIRTGGELWIMNKFLALRGGYTSNEITLGGSIHLFTESFGLQFDYAYLQDILGEGPTNQFSFRLHF